jgi:hypothetical protein
MLDGPRRGFASICGEAHGRGPHNESLHVLPAVCPILEGPSHYGSRLRDNLPVVN